MIVPHSEVDLLHYDPNRFPLFGGLPYSETILGPGDALYIPRWTWHFVEAIDAPTALSKRRDLESMGGGSGGGGNAGGSGGSAGDRSGPFANAPSGDGDGHGMGAGGGSLSAVASTSHLKKPRRGRGVGGEVVIGSEGGGGVTEGCGEVGGGGGGETHSGAGGAGGGSHGEEEPPHCFSVSFWWGERKEKGGGR